MQNFLFVSVFSISLPDHLIMRIKVFRPFIVLRNIYYYKILDDTAIFSSLQSSSSYTASSDDAHSQAGRFLLHLHRPPLIVINLILVAVRPAVLLHSGAGHRRKGRGRRRAIPTILSLKGQVHIWTAAAAAGGRAATRFDMRLELVLAGKGPPANGTSVRPLAGMEQLVTNHVLGPRELLAAHVAGELVVRLGLVRLQVLRQLAQFYELFPAFAAGVDGGAACVGVHVAGGGGAGEGRGGGG